MSSNYFKIIYNYSMSKNRRRQLTNKRKRFIITNVFLAMFLFIGIGYSALFTNLNISGDITVKKMQEPIIEATSSDDRTAFRSDTYREKIKTITLDDQINPPNNIIESWDIGVSQTGNVMAYVTQNSDDNTMYDLYIQGNGHLYANEDSSCLFYNLKGVDSITGIDKLDTSRVTDMSYMFYTTGNSSTVFTLDLGDKFDTSNVTDMSYMFSFTGFSNNNLILDLSTFDFSNVISYFDIFYCMTTTKKIYVKDAAAQSWIINNSGNSALTTSNVLIKT